MTTRRACWPNCLLTHDNRRAMLRFAVSVPLVLTLSGCPDHDPLAALSRCDAAGDAFAAARVRFEDAEAAKWEAMKKLEAAEGKAAQMLIGKWAAHGVGALFGGSVSELTDLAVVAAREEESAVATAKAARYSVLVTRATLDEARNDLEKKKTTLSEAIEAAARLRDSKTAACPWVIPGDFGIPVRRIEMSQTAIE